MLFSLLLKKYKPFFFLHLIYLLIFLLFNIFNIDIYDIFEQKSYFHEKLYINLSIIFFYFFIKYTLLLMVYKITIKYNQFKVDNFLFWGILLVYIFSNAIVLIVLPQYSYIQDGNSIALKINFFTIFKKDTLFFIKCALLYILLLFIFRKIVNHIRRNHVQ